MERGLLPRATPILLLPQVVPSLGGTAGAGVGAGLALGFTGAGTELQHPLCASQVWDLPCFSLHPVAPLSQAGGDRA